MISVLLGWELGIGIFGDEISKCRLLALELARLVVWLDPVCDGGFIILRGSSIQQEHDNCRKKKDKDGQKRIAAYRHCREAGCSCWGEDRCSRELAEVRYLLSDAMKDI